MDILEHMRMYDGKLFQDEIVIAFFLDCKAFLLTVLSSLQRTSDKPAEALQDLMNWSDETQHDLVQKFSSVHVNAEASLNVIVKIYAKLLQKNGFVAHATVSQCLRGLFKRVCLECMHSFSWLNQDPLKLDFCFREMFRMTLHNDCMVCFEQEVAPKDTSNDATAVALQEADQPSVDSTHEERIVNDLENTDDQVLDAKIPEDDVTDESSAAPSPLPDLPMIHEPVRVQFDDSSSVVSRAVSAIASVSTAFRKPNVKTIVLTGTFDDDDGMSRVSRLRR